MIQGTGSGVGKSIITAALCRHFYNKGHKVAPFKAQNMANNAFVTKDGGEIGRAQAFQAEASGVEPHVTMNPILLKPCSDNSSQVIIMGKLKTTSNAKDYYDQFDEHLSCVTNAFTKLHKQYDLIIMEGAGSPAEINLKRVDLVNMKAAEIANASVLLVGDIDKGGVFAWLKGTLDLLNQKERDRVRGRPRDRQGPTGYLGRPQLPELCRRHTVLPCGQTCRRWPDAAARRPWRRPAGHNRPGDHAADGRSRGRLLGRREPRPAQRHPGAGATRGGATGGGVGKRPPRGD